MIISRSTCRKTHPLSSGVFSVGRHACHSPAPILLYPLEKKHFRGLSLLFFPLFWYVPWVHHEQVDSALIAGDHMSDTMLGHCGKESERMGLDMIKSNGKTKREKFEYWWRILLIIVLSATVYCLGAPGSVRADGSIGSRLSSEEVRTLLALHNRVREEVGVGPLAWSAGLAIYAQSWADHLASTSCRMEHRPRAGRWKQIYGENLLMGKTGHHGVADAVRAWEREKHLYHGAALNQSNWHPSGHYTQMVWRTTRLIGCAKSKCRDNVIVVCNYDPPGNVLGQKPY